ncbi:MAG: hypothetical protein JJT89_09000 [Nitriliruptoraceae bacterium]|nr:hypothetical protein [Nitriliruptoraceae bacterium]
MDRAVRVALLACDRPDPDLIDIDGDYAEMFVRRFGAVAGDALRFEVVDVVGGHAPPAVGTHDAVLITGSRRGVEDEGSIPWIAALADHVRDLHDAQVPTVGVCFGHQLIAHALGGRVERAPNGWGVGVHHAQRVTDDPIVPARFRLLVSHQDQVLELPPGGEVLATSAHAPIAALRVGSLLGIQGHPEFRVPYAAALLENREHRIPAEVAEVANASFTVPTDHEAVLRWLSGHLGHPVPATPA